MPGPPYLMPWEDYNFKSVLGKGKKYSLSNASLETSFLVKPNTNVVKVNSPSLSLEMPVDPIAEAHRPIIYFQRAQHVCHYKGGLYIIISYQTARTAIHNVSFPPLRATSARKY